MKFFKHIILAVLLHFSVVAFAQLESAAAFYKNFHPNRIFSIELSTTIGFGKSENTFLFFNNQYAIWQRPQQFLSLKTGVGVGFMRNDFGKMVSVGMPLHLLYSIGKKGHFFEASVGGRFLLGFSLADGIQMVPFVMPTLGYRYQIPSEVFFNVYAAMQYHPNLGFAPLIGVGIGYDY